MLAFPDVLTSKKTESSLLSKYGAMLDIVLRASDVVIVVGAACVMHWLRFGHLQLAGPYALGLEIAALLTLLVFPTMGLYRSWRGEHLGTQLRQVWAAWSLVALLLVALEWAFKSTGSYSRVLIGACFLVGGGLLSLDRVLVRLVLGFIRSHGIDTRRVVLVGRTQAGLRVVTAARSNAWMGLEVIGYVRTDYDLLDIDGLECLGDIDEFIAKVDEHRPDQIWAAVPMGSESIIRQMLDLTDKLPVTVRLVPDLFGYELLSHQVSNLADVPVITLRGSHVNGHARVFKAVLDCTLAVMFLTAISPLLLLLAVGVKLSSPGPVFYRQRRVGLDGKEFDMLKFRSMPVDVEKIGVRWGGAGNKSATKFGRFIRRTSLDELPQFFNVLRGDLSIVGPRPERTMFVEQFKHSIPGYMHKHLVKGGITGWAQIHGLRGDTDLAKRIEYDLHYINHWSVWLDIKIMMLTPLVLFKQARSVQ